MKKAVFTLILVLLLTNSGLSDCYLAFEEQDLIDVEAVSRIALMEISRYVEPVAEIPAEGISAGSCLYRLELNETKNDLLLLIKGPKLNSYAQSQSKNLRGFQEALFRVVIKEYPEHHQDICRRNPNVMETDCADVATHQPPQQSDEVYFDGTTGLSWLKAEPGKLNWNQADTYCSNLTLAGFKDWRLPDETEIKSTGLIDYNFPDLNQGYYWSSTIDPADRDYAMAYDVTNGNTFSDWIKNRYYVRCVRGKRNDQVPVLVTLPESQTAEEPADEVIPYQELENPTGIRWVVGPTYISGYGDVVELYIHNLEELGYTKDEESTGYPVGASFNPYWQMDSGFRFGAGAGPLMSLVVSAGSKDYEFVALPVDVNAGYSLSNGLFFKGGISVLNASGDFVSSETVGFLGAAGMEFNRKRAVAFGFEVGFNSATVEIDKYDCSAVVSPEDFSDCEKEPESTQAVGFTTSFIVIF